MFTGKYGAENCWGQSVVPERYEDIVKKLIEENNKNHSFHFAEFS